jgi:hypothetical protein
MSLLCEESSSLEFQFAYKLGDDFRHPDEFIISPSGAYLVHKDSPYLTLIHNLADQSLVARIEGPLNTSYTFTADEKWFCALSSKVTGLAGEVPLSISYYLDVYSIPQFKLVKSINLPFSGDPYFEKDDSKSIVAVRNYPFLHVFSLPDFVAEGPFYAGGDFLMKTQTSSIVPGRFWAGRNDKGVVLVYSLQDGSLIGSIEDGNFSVEEVSLSPDGHFLFVKMREWKEGTKTFEGIQSAISDSNAELLESGTYKDPFTKGLPEVRIYSLPSLKHEKSIHAVFSNLSSSPASDLFCVVDSDLVLKGYSSSDLSLLGTISGFPDVPLQVSFDHRGENCFVGVQRHGVFVYRIIR